jgi:uncharacterized protein (UPF0335 family)
MKNRLATRVEKLEQLHPERAWLYIWDDHIEPRADLEQRIAEAKAEGFDVVVVSWTKPDEPR